ncbi:hypothetical protein PO909_032281 [Leuciscus waleckii]
MTLLVCCDLVCSLLPPDDCIQVETSRCRRISFACILFLRRGGEPICQGIRRSGPLPCSSAFSGNIGCLAGVQWTWSGQHQVYP